MRNDILVFSGRSHPKLANDICRELGITLAASEVIRFSNENLMVQIHENVREADVFVVQTSTSPVNEYLVELLIYIDALKRASARRVTAVIPYFFYARSDKKDRPRISITARLVADLLEAAGCDRVLTMDLHAPQIQGFFKIPCDALQGFPIIAENILATEDLNDAVIVATDAGAAKEAGRYAAALNLELAIVDKRRDGDDEKARAEHLIGNVEGRTAIILDDEIASGRTLIEAAEFVKRAGARRIFAGATHAVLTGEAPQLLQDSVLERVLLTDTLPVPTDKLVPKIEPQPVAKLFAQAIERIHDGRSLSELFTGKGPLRKRG